MAHDQRSVGCLDLRRANFRTNPDCELVLLDRLSPAEQLILAPLTRDSECYGILRSRAIPGRSLKAVSRDTALLLFTLQQPGPLPQYATQALGPNWEATIAAMVLDEVLQVEVDGQLVSGPEASALFPASPKSDRPEGRLGALSRRAIEYGAALQLDDASVLSARLYCYNSVPASPLWCGLLPDEAGTAEYLGLARGPASRALARQWLPLPESGSWLVWRNSAREKKWPGAKGVYKLYISPGCDRLRDAVEAVILGVTDSAAIQWKIGKGVSGLLRPDKMVVYFEHFSHLQETAWAMGDALRGYSPQGVPFTAEIGADGLLSWGFDHVAQEGPLNWTETSSWRGKICDRLALALVQAGSSRIDAAGFARARLRLDGIDTNAWTPSRLPGTG